MGHTIASGTVARRLELGLASVGFGKFRSPTLVRIRLWLSLYLVSLDQIFWPEFEFKTLVSLTPCKSGPNTSARVRVDRLHKNSYKGWRAEVDHECDEVKL